MQHALHLQSPWSEVKEKLKENDIHLTDQDLAYEPGKEQELFKRLASKWNKSPEEVKDYIESVSANDAKAG